MAVQGQSTNVCMYGDRVRTMEELGSRDQDVEDGVLLTVLLTFD